MREMKVFMVKKALFFKPAMRKLWFGNFAPISEQFAGAQLSALFLFSLMSARVFHVRAKLVRSGPGNVFASAECDRQIATGAIQRLSTARPFSEQRNELTDVGLPRPSMPNL